MEKIKTKKDTNREKYEEKPNSTEEGAEFLTKWNKSPFNEPLYLEQISDELEAIEKDYEYSEEELGEMQKLTEMGVNNINLLEAALDRDNPENIQASALETILKIGKIAERADSDAVVLLLRIILKKSDQIIQMMSGGPLLQKQARIFLLNLANTDTEKTITILPILKDYIENIPNIGDLDSVDIKIMDWICLAGDKDDEENEFIRTLYEHFLEKPEDYKIILSCINADNGVIQEMGMRQIFEILKEYGFKSIETNIMVKKWISGGGSTKYMPEAFSRNTETIKSIEAERPGITKFLIDKFGIYNFGRYPDNLLIKQYDEYENQNLPYGVIVFAEDDHNGVYFEYKDELAEMDRGLNDKYLIRIAEVGGKKDLMRLFVRLRLKYAQNHKISFGILGAHGHESVITLGNVDNIGDREIYTRNVIKYGNRKYDLFEKNATLILLSCLSGVKNAIGSKVSKTMNVTTIAPKDSSGLESIKPTLEEGGLTFKVKYSHHVKAATFRPKGKTKKNFI